MSDRVGHELLEVPDTPPDRLAIRNGRRLRRRARRMRSDSFRERNGENENLNGREQDQTTGRNTALGLSYVSSSFLGTSCGMQYSLRDSFAQDEDHVRLQSTSFSSEMRPHQSSCGQTEGLQRQSFMETCNMSREDKNSQTLNIDELFHTAKEEVKRNDKETISGRAIPMPMQNRRKMLVRNGRISPNEIVNDATPSNKGVKRLREAGDNLSGSVMNDESADANNSVDGDQIVQSNSNSLPLAAQQDDTNKGKSIVSGDMVETSEDSCVKLLQCRKRVRGNSSGSGEASRLSVCKNSTSPRLSGSSGLVTEVRSQACRNDDFPYRSIDNVSGDKVETGEDSCLKSLQCRKRVRGNSSGSGEANRLSVCKNSTSPRLSGSSGLVTEVRSQACRNDVFPYRSIDNVSEGNMQLTCKPLGWSRMHQNKRQLSRLDRNRDRSPMSLVGDQGNLSEADSPEVVFLRSCRPSQRNISSTSSTSNAGQESSRDIEIVDHSPINVDSLEATVSDNVNLDKSNEEVGARARQIEQDEILARQLQEELAGEVLEGGLQQDDAILHSMVQREISQRIAASDSNNGPLFAGLNASFGIGARRRDPIHSLRIRPSLSPFQAGLPIVSPHRRREAVSGRWHRSSGRAFRERRFQFPPHMNIEMRVDMLEAMEHVVENNVAHQFLAGVQRDFNEDDYEMLLALDDDNDNCRGASPRHIDRLPISTVQNDTSDEVCSVCLEMPKSGEVIRHLLCMHKFHKECIDPWLVKQASCPICKLSI